MKFETQKYENKGVTPVHCPTEQQAQELMEFLTEQGYTWNNGKSLITDKKWDSYKDRTVYLIWENSQVTFAHVEFCRERKLIYIPFSDFIKKYGGPSLEEIMTHLDQRIQSMEERSTHDF